MEQKKDEDGIWTERRKSGEMKQKYMNATLHLSCMPYHRNSRHFEFVSVNGSFETAVKDLDAAAERAADEFGPVFAPTQTTDGVEIRDVLGF